MIEEIRAEFRGRQLKRWVPQTLLLIVLIFACAVLGYGTVFLGW